MTEQTNYETTESVLRAAFENSGGEAGGSPDLDGLRSRAHRELQARELIGFGLLQMVVVVLDLFGRLYTKRAER